MEDEHTASTMVDETTASTIEASTMGASAMEASTMEDETTASTMEDETPVQLDDKDHFYWKPGFEKHYLTLTSSQKRFADFLLKWFKNQRKVLLTVSGGPGTGKTYAVSETLTFCRWETLRMAYTGRAAYHIHGRTIHSTVQLDWSPKSLFEKLEQRLENVWDVNFTVEKSRKILGEFKCYKKPSIIILDEISMVSGWMTYWLIKYFMDRETPLLFIMMGDRNQLPPIRNKHNLYSFTKLKGDFEVNNISFDENKRFTTEYQRLMDELKSFMEEEKSGALEFLRKNFPVQKNITDTVLKQATRAMAYLNISVDHYNNFYIKRMMTGEETRLYTVRRCKSGYLEIPRYLDIKQNCPIFVNEYSNSDTKKGTPLTFITYNKKADTLECRGPDGSEVEVRRSNKTGGFPIDIGFAETIHKFHKVMDDEKIVISFSGTKDLRLIYRALSRVRDVNQILAVKL